MRQATFLWKNERGIYFFRVRIPKQYSEHFGCSEIKKSLKTDSHRVAVKLARAYRVELDKEMEKLSKGAYSAFEVKLTGRVKATLPNGTEKIIEGEITRDIASPEDTTPHKEYLLRQLREESERVEKHAREQALFEAQLAAIHSASAHPPTQQNESGPLFSEVIKTYIEEGAATRLNSKSTLCVENALKLFQEFAGDLPINAINKAVTRDFKAQYLKIPHKNARNAIPDYQNKRLTELAKMTIPKKDLIDPSTVGNNIGHLSTFFKWAVDNEYASINPFKELRPKVKKRASKQRDVFDHTDLKALFESDEYKTGFKRGNRLIEWRYWIPIIALYTGMRLEEISRLSVGNFTERDGIPIIDITIDECRDGKSDEEWSGKTTAALRPVPLHPTLNKLGLLRFVEQRQKAGKERLFDLNLAKDGYGTVPGRWFTKYRRKCGVNSSRKTFHSLRHTFANQMKQMKVPESIIGAIVGHEDQSITTGRYGKDYNISVLFEELSKVDYGLNHPAFKFEP